MTEQNKKDLDLFIEILQKLRYLGTPTTTLDKKIIVELDVKISDRIIALSQPEPEPEIRIRNKEEIQKAHDVILQIVEGKIEIISSPDSLKLMHAIGDVLCWVLMHDSGQAFQENIDKISSAAEKMGYELHRKS